MGRDDIRLASDATRRNCTAPDAISTKGTAQAEIPAARVPGKDTLGSGSGHGWVVRVTSLLFCNFCGQEVKMKCPKSEEFFGAVNCSYLGIDPAPLKIVVRGARWDTVDPKTIETL